MQFGIMADDNTGASDAAGMLTANGVRTLLVFSDDLLAPDRVDRERYDAVVLGTRIRAMSPEAARARTAAAMAALQALGLEHLYIKISSTFDSTPDGNIGPCLETAMQCLGVDTMLICPALPVNGRTVYQGHLFVGSRLLSESSMRDHPLNPMTDSDIVRWLDRQSTLPVRHIALPRVRQNTDGIEPAVREAAAAGGGCIVADAISDQDLA